jgi:pSer/pThr/pTyr-binding forkhead associated (FHA) protein
MSPVLAPEPIALPPPPLPPGQVPVAAQREAATALYPVPPTSAPLAIVEIRTLAGPASEFMFSGGSARVGRAWENEIVLPDDRVSRRHGQLTTRHGALVYSDLGSTNGSFVNGVRVSEIALGSGDIVRLGNSTLTIKPHH